MFSNFAITLKVLIDMRNAIFLGWPPDISTHHIIFLVTITVSRGKKIHFFMISERAQEIPLFASHCFIFCFLLSYDCNVFLKLLLCQNTHNAMVSYVCAGRSLFPPPPPSLLGF